MTELTADQLAQADRLHGAVAWVYPDTSNTAFWNNYFSGGSPTLTQAEQDSGISIGPAANIPFGPRGSNSQTSIPFGPSSSPAPQPEVLPGFDSNMLGGTTSSRPQFMLEPSAGPSGYPQVVGAAGSDPLSMGNVPYQSELIRSLRAANQAPASNNPGVTMLPNAQNSGLVLNFNKPAPTGLSNKPQTLQIKPVTPTPLVPDSPVGGGGGEGGSGGGGSIIIGPFDPVVDDNTGTDDGSDDSWSEWDDYTDTGDDSVTDDDSWSEWDDYTDTGDDQDTDGLDDLIDDALARDDAGNVPDYTDDLWGDDTGDVGDGDIPDYTDDLWGPGGTDDASDPDIPDYTDDLWGDNTDADADAIAQLYRDYLGREPDQAGLEWWDATGLSADDIAAVFGAKGEHSPISVDPGIPDYTDDLWGDDNLSVGDDQGGIPDYSDDLWGDDVAVDDNSWSEFNDYTPVDTGGGNDIGIDLGQADNLGGMYEMYDPFGSSSPIVLDLKGEDYSTNFGSDWLMNELFGGFAGGGGGGGGGGKPWDDGFVVLVHE